MEYMVLSRTVVLRLTCRKGSTFNTAQGGWLVDQFINAISFGLKHGLWTHDTRSFKIPRS